MNGLRIIYDEKTGIPLLTDGEQIGDVKPRQELNLKYLDLPFDYNENNFKKAKSFHIENGKIIIDEYFEKSQEEYIKELEDKLLNSNNII